MVRLVRQIDVFWSLDFYAFSNFRYRDSFLSDIHQIIRRELSKMRRNARGGGQAWTQRPMASRASTGPIMTEHLGLQDIDKELELLKRKREIIEQQQQILSNEFRRNDYQQPSYGQNQSRFDDYAQLYDDMRDRDGPSRKRPIAVWEDEIPVKRFSAPTRPSRPRGSFAPRALPSLLEAPMRRPPPPQRRPQPKPDRRKEVNLPKVTKTSTQPANKLNSYPAAQRKKLVTDAADLTRKGPIQNELQNTLLADVIPSKQVTGRLELALGGIIKDIKATPKHEDIKNISVMRGVKSVIRERIRDMMMGKVVGTSETIKTKYREIYDLQSDFDVVDEAVNAHKGEITLVNIDDPETYFKNNMYRIVQMKLKNMLEKLEEISRAENPSAKPIPAPENKKTDLDAKMPPLDETIFSTELYTRLEKTMAAKMTFMLKKFLPYITKIMDIDFKYVKLKNTVINETARLLRAKEGIHTAIDVESSDVSMASGNASPNKSLNASGHKEPYKPLPYFCKIMGKPSLPKRKQMEIFFNQFKPKSIKKHRTVHNLLFVGFIDKDNFEKMLAADGTVIGKHTLSIRVSERATEVPKKDLDASKDSVIGPDLDMQITDLLSSIRKAEENGEATDNTEGNGAVDNADGDGAGQIDDENGITENTDGHETAEIADENETNENNQETANADGNGSAENADQTETVYDPDADTTICNDDDAVVNADEGGNADEQPEAETDIIEGDPAAVADAIIAASNNAGTNDEITDNSSTEQNIETNVNEGNNIEDVEKVDIVQPMAEVKPVAKGTPARVSARLAGTPSRIQTRRASRLTQND